MARSKVRDRTRREAAVVSNLEWLQKNDPARFAEAMRILASLVATARAADR